MAKNLVTLTFAADSASLDKALSKLQGQTDTTSSRFQKFGRVAKVAAVGVFAGLAVAAKSGYEELKEAQKVSAVTENAFKKLGGSVQFTAKDVNDLSGALMRKTGVDDEQIQSNANLLLANRNFTKGLGNTEQGLQRVITAGMDWATVTGKDSTSAITSLNKAMANPIKGMAQLEKAGVSFTAAERDKIKALVDSGKVTAAQDIIVGKLEQSYGGAATAAGKTLSGQLDVAKQTFNNLAGSMVGAVLPAFNAFAGILNTVLGWLSQHTTTTKVLIGVVAGLAAGVWAVNAAAKVWAATQLALNAVLAANPLGLVITAVAALAAGIIYAYKHSETFRNVVDGAFSVAKRVIDAVRSAVDAVVDAIRAAMNSPVIEGLKKAFDLYIAPIKAVVNGVSDAISAITGAIRAVKDSEALSRIGGAFSSAFAAVKSTIDGIVSAINGISSALRTALGLFSSLFSRGKTLSAGEFVNGIRAAGRAAQGRANGGLVTKPEFSLIGEAGPEAVIPLSRPARAAEVMRQAGLGGGGGVGVVMNVTVVDQTMAGMSREQARRVADAIAPELRRMVTVG